ncbi:hypothetical protein SBA3_430014 [Candidatus Sulfopaludibacter sp. SbA3]|nr:hypothetical protein SBA3_430014 [Candidatus Sulfopaludibacter sp. SbA3]
MKADSPGSATSQVTPALDDESLVACQSFVASPRVRCAPLPGAMARLTKSVSAFNDPARGGRS